MLKVYDMNGVVVLSQKFHSGAIKQISIRTSSLDEHDADELVLLYADQVVVIGIN